jgi:hypothetical protein
MIVSITIKSMTLGITTLSIMTLGSNCSNAKCRVFAECLICFTAELSVVTSNVSPFQPTLTFTGNTLHFVLPSGRLQPLLQILH